MFDDGSTCLRDISGMLSTRFHSCSTPILSVPIVLRPLHHPHLHDKLIFPPVFSRHQWSKRRLHQSVGLERKMQTAGVTIESDAYSSNCSGTFRFLSPTANSPSSISRTTLARQFQTPFSFSWFRKEVRRFLFSSPKQVPYWSRRSKLLKGAEDYRSISTVSTLYHS